MDKKKRMNSPEIDFSKITPGMQIEKVKHSPLYEKALLRDRKTAKSDYSKNTTTWE